jgi:putative ATP-dependent endonuclease of OLD family
MARANPLAGGEGGSGRKPEPGRGYGAATGACGSALLSSGPPRRLPDVTRRLGRLLREQAVRLSRRRHRRPTIAGIDPTLDRCNYAANTRGICMRISRIEVENFRALTHCAVNVDALTAIIGMNNAGKSAFLQAIRLFFDNAPKVDDDDFSKNNTAQAIDITLHFAELTPEERILFSSNLLDSELVVTRRLISGNPKDSGSFFVTARVNPDFVECRNETGKTLKKELYNKLREQYELPAIKASEEADAHLEEWEAAHPDALKAMKVGSFRGFKNVAVGQLKKRTDFIFVPAVREAGQDAGDAKNSPARQLVDALARQTIENNKDFQAFVEMANGQMRAFTDPANVPALAKISISLTSILQKYYSESQIIATWDPIERIPIAFPTSRLSICDQEFTSDVERMGQACSGPSS